MSKVHADVYANCGSATTQVISLTSTFLWKFIERDREPFPRGYLKLFSSGEQTGMRGIVNTKADFEVLTQAYDSDFFVNLFSEYQRKEREYDMLYLDVDAKDDNGNPDLHKAYIRTDTLIERLIDAGIKKYFVMFSGAKGFHIYVPFEPVRLLDYRRAAETWMKINDVWDLIDTSAVEPNRVVRLPYTINSKSQMMCIPIGNEFDLSLADVMKHSKVEHGREFTIAKNAHLGKDLLKCDSAAYERAMKSTQTIVEGGRSQLFTDEKAYPPCIARLVSMARQGVDLNHRERWELGKFLMHVYGGNVDVVKEFYMKMSDYKEQVTTYQLNHIHMNNMKMSGCDALDDEGICCRAKNECPFYPTMGKFMMSDIRLMKARIQSDRQ